MCRTRCIAIEYHELQLPDPGLRSQKYVIFKQQCAAQNVGAVFAYLFSNIAKFDDR